MAIKKDNATDELKKTFDVELFSKTQTLHFALPSAFVRKSIWKVQEQYESLLLKKNGNPEVMFEHMDKFNDDELKIITEGKNTAALSSLFFSKFGSNDIFNQIRAQPLSQEEKIEYDEYCLKVFQCMIDTKKIQNEDVKAQVTGDIENDFYQNLDLTFVQESIAFFRKRNRV